MLMDLHKSNDRDSNSSDGGDGFGEMATTTRSNGAYKIRIHTQHLNHQSQIVHPYIELVIMVVG